jgi:hypothetical protein
MGVIGTDDDSVIGSVRLETITVYGGFVVRSNGLMYNRHLFDIGQKRAV